MTKWITSFALCLALAPAALAAEGGSSVFAGTIAQSIAAILVFLILLAVLYKLAWGPILGGLQDREARIKQDLESAENSAKQAQATLQEYQVKLAQAQEQARKTIEQGRSDAEKLAAQLKADTQAEIEQIRQRARNEIRVAKEEALAEIYARTASLATDVAGRILKREIKPEDQRDLVQDALASLDRNAK